MIVAVDLRHKQAVVPQLDRILEFGRCGSSGAEIDIGAELPLDLEVEELVLLLKVLVVVVEELVAIVEVGLLVNLKVLLPQVQQVS